MSTADRLREGRLATFHGLPAAAEAPLRAVLAGTVESDPAHAEAGWVLGAAQAAVGRFGHALHTFDGVMALAAQASGPHRRYAGLAACSAAAVHRQLGLFERARTLDEWAGRTGAGLPEVEVNATTGLCADAVGMGSAERALAALEDAQARCRNGAGGWREAVRVGWVAAEAHLLAGAPAHAERALRGSLRIAHRRGAPRHVAKSLAFVAVARRECGWPGVARDLEWAAIIAESVGAEPLVWSTRSVLADWSGPRNAQEARRHRIRAADAAARIAGELPADLRAVWIERPDVARLQLD